MKAITFKDELPECYYKYKPGTYFIFESNTETVIGRITRRHIEKIKRGQTIPAEGWASKFRPYFRFHYKEIYYKSNNYYKHKNIFWETSDIEKKSTILSEEEAMLEVL
jgi:hypothetical protein